MTNENEAMTVIRDEQDALINLDYDNVLQIAERADRMVGALNKIMSAAIKITTPRDWVLIGGTPYLQEAGASKVARLFGISWKIHEGYPQCSYDNNGYPTFTYRMTFSLGGQSIEAEGMRSGADEFFTGKGDNKKGADAIDVADVKRAAYTNCLNRGIKGILPGLRNLDAKDLEDNGIRLDKAKGYTFKEGSRGGNSGKAADSGLVCDACGKAISQKVASFSQGKYNGRKLCMDCQKAADKGAINLSAEDFDDLPPFPGDEDAPAYGGGR